jgi:hypothetical protein
VENISENCWQWQMTPSGAGGSYFDIIYACSYNINHEEFTINWTPVEDIGNAVVHGRWCVFEQYAKIYLDIVIKVPFPKVFCKIANQIANKIFSISMNKHLKQLENYLKE